MNLRNWLSQPETFAKHFLKQSYKGFLNRACATLFISTFCCKSKRNAFMSQLFEKLFFAENDHKSDQTDVHVDVCVNDWSSMTKCTQKQLSILSITADLLLL